MREVKFESYFGRKVAIDASMHIYQFMVRASARAAATRLAHWCSRTRLAPRRRWWADKATCS